MARRGFLSEMWSALAMAIYKLGQFSIRGNEWSM
jgi:hypothetical protein